MACGILVPQPGIERTFPALQDGFLTTGPSGSSFSFILSPNSFEYLVCAWCYHGAPRPGRQSWTGCPLCSCLTQGCLQPVPRHRELLSAPQAALHPGLAPRVPPGFIGIQTSASPDLDHLPCRQPGRDPGQGRVPVRDAPWGAAKAVSLLTRPRSALAALAARSHCEDHTWLVV